MTKSLLIFFILLIFSIQCTFKPISLNQLIHEEISVEVRGAVVEEKIVNLPPYSTIDDVLESIELAPNADIEPFNKSIIVNDHDVITIPFKKDEHDERININTASVDELITLPGVGEATALRIIDYRENISLFCSIEDIQNVKGIGPAKFEKMKDKIAV